MKFSWHQNIFLCERGYLTQPKPTIANCYTANVGLIECLPAHRHFPPLCFRLMLKGYFMLAYLPCTSLRCYSLRSKVEGRLKEEWKILSLKFTALQFVTEEYHLVDFAQRCKCRLILMGSATTPRHREILSKLAPLFAAPRLWASTPNAISSDATDPPRVKLHWTGQ